MEMSEKNHFAALQEIRKWNTDDVICALNNNGLGECVDACRKRDITGEKLLELSEMTLGLWKRDLTISNIRKLATFIQDISKMPATYTICNVSSNSEDAWDTDFDDDDDDDDEKEEDNNQKTGANPKREFEQANVFHQESRNSSVQNIVNKIYNSQNNDHQFFSISRNRSSQYGNKINIPPAFSSISSSSSSSSSQNGSSIISSINSTVKSQFLKSNCANELVRSDPGIEPKKPAIPSQPPNLHLKSSPKGSIQSALPKPPPFDNAGLVLREICHKVRSQLKNDMDEETEYASIDDDVLFARDIKHHISQSNGLGNVPHLPHQNSLENVRKSPVLLNSENDEIQQEALPFSSLHQNQSRRNSTSTQQMPEVDQNTTAENLRKSPILPPAHANMQGPFQVPKNMSFAHQEKLENAHARRSPVLLPPRNEIRQDVSPTSTLHRTAQMNCNRINECFTTGTTMTQRLSKEYDDNKNDEENDVGEGSHQEEVYESIPEQESKKCIKLVSCIYIDGYVSPIAPPSLPRKPQQTPGNVKIVEKLNSVESNDTVGCLWPFGPQKNKSQQTQEKSSPNGKKTNTLPTPRSVNGQCPSESPRPSVSRPLPPPPANGGVQRVVKIPVEQMPWYFSVDRARGEDILRNSEDGTFIIRPSTKAENAFTLTLKYGKRPFNIGIRHRSDGRFALGTAKPTEQTFSSVEELVNYYTSNELLLYSNGNKAGIVVLTSPPRKETLNQ